MEGDAAAAVTDDPGLGQATTFGRDDAIRPVLVYLRSASAALPGHLANG